MQSHLQALRLAAIGIGVTAMIAGCGPRPNGAKNAANGSATPASAVTVNVATASRGDIKREIDVTGSLVALSDVRVGPKHAGKLVAVNVREGDSVTAGQIVAVMETDDIRNQVAQAEAALRSAETRLLQTKAQVIQARKGLQNAQTTLEWTRKTTETAVRTAEAGVKTAEERLAVVKQGARDQEVRSAEAQVRAAKTNLDKARADLKRYEQLRADGAIAPSTLDQFKAAAEAAEAQYDAARETLSLVREGARREEVRQAELAVQTAREALARAQADREQVRLREADVVREQSGVEVAEAGVKNAEAGVAQARAGLQIARQALDDCFLRAPISGVVAERLAEPGQQIAGGGMGTSSQVLRIVAPSSIVFEAVLSESQYAEVRVGQQVAITVDAFPGRQFSGRVTRVFPVASQAARSFTVRVDFAGDGALRPQMFARGRILIDTHRGTVLVPKDAVVFDPVGNRSRVFVKSGDRVRERIVRVGFSTPEKVEIVSGVSEGEEVVTAGQTVLQDGDTVQVQ
jgi:RND family efflux transporter MFP subunit